ncbi:PREDICTED: putative cyclin-dependent serine/threonine-protein kinase DDB_G0272797/DDB_G0274007 [Drosophila arizonae]|uniref:Cyclin-dependent serine/threonine-protein kinase DDB_G0272797/DDB_G0274007 n=1 Tax=Drosophila arizonae TaxID=7263 RepID=A0ABM1NMF8_DROAR|nr:PREDICTED: putative cyclin-dependent serine/threonine-protein kinase DDB_G0272797/DDB_G0274007 [Drosophila arizonae]
MSSPCGKCNTCACSGQTTQPSRQEPCGQCGQVHSQPQHQVNCPSQQQQQQQPRSYSGPQQQQQQSSYGAGQSKTTGMQNEKRSRVECRCVPNKDRRNAPVQAPLADTYTCLRPRPQPQAPEQPMCTCKQQTAPATCECAPPIPIQRPPVNCDAQNTAPPTHAYISCGTPTNVKRQPDPCTGPTERDMVPPYMRDNTKTKRQSCSHCQSQKQKKKCVIQ